MVANAQLQARRPQETKQNEPVKWLTQEWLEPRLVAITALAIVASFIAHQLDAPAWVDGVLGVIAYVAGGFYGLQTALHSLFVERVLDVDLLMVLAALGAAVIGEWHEGAILLFLFSLSNVLQDYAIGRSRNAIKSLFKLYPEEAKVKRGEEIIVVKFNEITVGDTVLIEPGERIPVDGDVIDGASSVDESPITGESMPIDKAAGAKVFAGTLNKQGALDVRATKAAGENTLARIIQMVEDAQENQAPTERFLERFEQYYAGFIVFAVLLIIVIPPLFFSADFSDNFYRAMVLMTVASPCALVISVPASFISAIASAARMGVLFKGGAYLETMATIKAVAFDKTGTLTRGKPVVTDVVSCCDMGEADVLAVAAAAESRSEHPLAKAIVNEATSRNITIQAITDFEAVAGRGVVAIMDDNRIRVGSMNHLKELHPVPPRIQETFESLEAQGKTAIGVVQEGHCEGCGECEFGRSTGCDWMGVVALADELRPEAIDVIADLRANGIDVAMFTGDNERVAQAIAQQVGITRVHAGLMPEDKVTALQALQSEIGAVAMVGDGVNDAPALATAEIGMAMGAAGTDVALETADVVLMGDRLDLIRQAVDLSKKARRVVWQNITFSLAVIVMLVMGALFIDLPLPLGVLGHEGSTVIVVLNGLIALLIIPEIARRRAGTQGS
jgi:Cd2+/Zn2+-exporting ATPase